jgi:hypothetical protein
MTKATLPKGRLPGDQDFINELMEMTIDGFAPHVARTNGIISINQKQHKQAAAK